MRVAAIIATEAVSGPGRQLAALADPLRHAGVDLHVLVLSRQHRAMPAYASYLNDRRVPHTLIRDRGPADWRIVRDVARAVGELDADIVQTHGYKATAAGYLLRRTAPARPWIAFYHGATDMGVKDTVYHALERRCLRGADRIAIVSEAQRKAVGAESHVRVIANAVLMDTTRDDPGLDGAFSLAPGSGPRIGVIGRLSREKGVDVFLHACAALNDRAFPFSAHIIGDGPEAGALRQLCSTLQLDAQVSFAGRVDPVGPVYRQLDLVVLPSRSEGLPNVLLEALAADRPVVATAVGAVPEVLCVPDSGVLVPPGAATQLAEAMIAALQRGATPGASAARATTLKRYGLEQRVQRHLELYREVAAARRQSAVSA
jgi:glycosyltransferase involved in cell wall biosynthesis